MTKTRPVGADLLRLFGHWLAGVRLAAGECLLSPTQASARLLGQPCGRPGCRSLICGPTDAELTRHLTDHLLRCHR